MHEPFARRAPLLYYSLKGNIPHDRATSNSAGRSTLARGLILAWVKCAVYSVRGLIPRTKITSWQVWCLHMQRYVPSLSHRGTRYRFCILLRFIYLSVLFRSRFQNTGPHCLSFNSKRLSITYYNYLRSHYIFYFDSLLLPIFWNTQTRFGRALNFQNDDRPRRPWVQRLYRRRRSHCLNFHRFRRTQLENVHEGLDRAQHWG